MLHILEEIKMKYLLVIILSIIISSSQINSQELKVPITEIQPVAQMALKTFMQLITESNYKQMGFENLNEVQTATLGIPLQDFIVPLDNLMKFTGSFKFEEFLIKTNLINYPVLVKDQIRSSLTISKSNEKWQPVSYGGSNMIKLIFNNLTINKKQTGLPESSYFIVQIPSLNLYFLGYKIENDLMLVPILDDSSLDFKAGSSIKAERVFNSVLPLAKAHDGLPR
jgi:hypothetical protein